MLSFASQAQNILDVGFQFDEESYLVLELLRSCPQSLNVENAYLACVISVLCPTGVSNLKLEGWLPGELGTSGLKNCKTCLCEGLPSSSALSLR